MPSNRYINVAAIARHVGVTATAVWHWIDRYPPGHPTHPTPTPDAWEETTRGDKPLWLDHCMPDWEAWRANHPHRSTP